MCTESMKKATTLVLLEYQINQKKIQKVYKELYTIKQETSTHSTKL